MEQKKNAPLFNENNKGVLFLNSSKNTENINILNSLKEDFKLISGKNIFPTYIPFDFTKANKRIRVNFEFFSGLHIGFHFICSFGFDWE